MTKSAENEKLMRKLYGALAEGDHSVSQEIFSDDIEFNVIRSLPVSRHKGKDAANAYVAQTLGWTPLDGDMELEHLAASDDIVFSLHVEAKGTDREHRHVMVWKVDDGKVVEVNELTFGDPPSMKGVDIEKLEALGHKVVVLAAGSAGA